MLLDQVEDAKDFLPAADHQSITRLPPAQDAVPVDDERRAERDVALLVEDAVSADRGPMHAAQQRNRDLSRVREGGVTGGAVAADADDRRAPLTRGTGDLPEIAELRRSDAAEVVAVEDEDDVGLAAKVRERDRLAADRRQRELR